MPGKTGGVIIKDSATALVKFLMEKAGSVVHTKKCVIVFS